MLIDLETAKGYLGINSPTKDVEISMLVNYVNTYILEFCSIKNTSDTATSYTRRVTSAAGRNAVLPSTQITSVTKVLNNGIELEEEDYFLDTDSGILVFYTDVTTKPFGISVTYEEGPFVASADLVFAAVELLKYFYKDEYKNAVSSGQGDSVSFEISKNIPNKIRHILTHHREL